jgi:signal transduction histidine kinase
MKKLLLCLLLVYVSLSGQPEGADRLSELTSELQQEIDPGQDKTLTVEDIIDDEEEIVEAPAEEVVTVDVESDAILPVQPKGIEKKEVETDVVMQGFLRDTKPPEEVAAPIQPADKLVFDTDKKRKEVIDLVTRAIKELETQPLDIACNRFSHTKQFIHGDLYIFLFNIDGVCLAHGDDGYLIWQNLINLKDWVGTPVVQQIIKKAQTGGGWVTYGWNNSTKVAYVQMVQKEGKSYIIGSGYFPHSKEEAVVNLVKGGVALFNQVKKSKQPIYWAFSRMNYPTGPFVSGNLYLYALDFKGNIMAQADRPGLIGTNAWSYQDERGLFVNQEIIKKLEKTSEGEGIWVEYISKRAPKKAYAEKVTDAKGTKYFIACGYYPDANRQATIDLVRKGYQFMKTSGKSSAIAEFSQRRSDEYRYGDLYLIVYDMKGKIIADGGNADNIGRNMYNVVDQDGSPYIQRILKRATKEGIWINAKIQGSFQSTYAQKIDLGISQFVITCNYYPVSKPETMMLLVQSGTSFLQANPREEAFAQFVKRDGRFRRGDLQLTVVDTEGLCYAYGDDVDLIWRNIFDIKDETGRPFIKMFINEVRQGPVVVKTKLNNAIKTNYVTSLDKDGKTYVISSGYYN